MYMHEGIWQMSFQLGLERTPFKLAVADWLVYLFKHTLRRVKSFVIFSSQSHEADKPHWTMRCQAHLIFSATHGI